MSSIEWTFSMSMAEPSNLGMKHSLRREGRLGGERERSGGEGGGGRPLETHFPDLKTSCRRSEYTLTAERVCWQRAVSHLQDPVRVHLGGHAEVHGHSAAVLVLLSLQELQRTR